MKQSQIEIHIRRALRLQAQAKALLDEIATIKAELLEHVRHSITGSRTGAVPPGTTQKLLEENGGAVDICFPAHKLISSFWMENGVAFREKDEQPVVLTHLHELSWDCFEKLFETYYKPHPEIRALAPALINDRSRVEELIKLIEEPSSPRITFKPKK